MTHFKELIKKFSKPLAIISVIAVTVIFAVGGSLAWLHSETNEIANTLNKVKVSCEVDESFVNGIKSDVKIKNTGDIDAFIRVSLVYSWQDEDGNIVALPSSIEDFDIDINSTDWFMASDGYYYFKSRVPSQGLTENLINSATVNTLSDGYKAGYNMNLQIICEAIQALPDTTVETVWKTVEVDGNGTLTSEIS